MSKSALLGLRRFLRVLCFRNQKSSKAFKKITYITLCIKYLKWDTQHTFAILETEELLT